jgi:arginine/serine-rich splicing factor 7
MSQTRNRSHGGEGSRSRSKSKSKSRSRSRFQSLSSTSSGRAAQAPKWDGESGYRLHVSPLNPRTSRRDIEKIFGKFGSINEVWMATNPPCFAFVNFKHRADAEDAMQSLDGKMIDNSRVGVSFARKRTIGGRRGGSFNNGGDRYSRGGDHDSSRYRRRYSPRPDERRRRYSRSRSPVQSNKRDYRQRSRSPSPKARRNRPSSRDRSPQQQATNVVRRYSDNDDRSE